VNIKSFMSKKVVAIGLAAGITLGLGGAAFAYFTASGSVSGAAAVGDATSATWGITQSSETGTMYPGQGSTAITYTIKNLGSGNQALESKTLAASVYSNPNTPNAGDVMSNGSVVAGCLASWFTPAIGVPTTSYGTSILPGATENVTVTWSMTDDPSSQDACQGVSPVVSLAASA
jgi:hypothetical protein